MKDSDRCEELRVALDSLLFVRAGHSERSAVEMSLDRGEDPRITRDRALRLVRATLERWDELERIVSASLPGKMSLREKCLANLAAVIVHDGGTPSSETIGCLRLLSPDDFRRDLEYFLGVAQTYEPSQKLGVGEDEDRIAGETHNPPWWVNYCIRTFGRGRALKLLSNPSRPRYIRVNSLRTNQGLTLPREAEGLGNVLEANPSVPGIFRVGKSPPSLSRLLSRGLMQFQDLASYCAVMAAGPKLGESVLDLCAAPGAKTSALAQLMHNSGQIVSVDYSASRMKNWAREMKRLGVEIATPIMSDATRLGLMGPYELVLLDPPCSGTGILDRNPEMKWHLTPELVSRYSQLQARMLDEAYRLMSPEGRILYSTCSLTLEENEEVISAFVGAHPEMETVTLPLSPDLGSAGMSGLGNCRRFYPYRDKTAGYFIARLEHV